MLIARESSLRNRCIDGVVFTRITPNCGPYLAIIALVRTVIKRTVIVRASPRPLSLSPTDRRRRAALWTQTARLFIRAGP